MRSWLLLVPACLASEKTYVQMDVKNYGSVVIELEDTKVLTTVDNFLSYVDDEYYDELEFHRVIKGFMIQVGGYDRQYEKQPTNDPIPLEADRGLDNDKGTIAIHWQAEDGNVVLRWTETRPSIKVPDGHEGFGSMLMRSAARQLGGEIERNFTEGRMVVEMRIPQG